MLPKTVSRLVLLWLICAPLRSQQVPPVKNFRLAVDAFWNNVCVSENWVAFIVPEDGTGSCSSQRIDLNGDGDLDDDVLHVCDLTARAIVNLELAVVDQWIQLSGKWLAFVRDEGEMGEDLNGDGDADDFVVHVYDLEVKRVTNLGLATPKFSLTSMLGRPVLLGKQLALAVSEEFQGTDLNQDGDTEDDVLHVRDLEAGLTRNLSIAVKHSGGTFRLAENWLAFEAYENSQGADLNGDGDRDDAVLHLGDLETGETTNLSLAGELGLISQNWIEFLVSEEGQGQDLNADGDTSDDVFHLHNVPAGETTNLGLAWGFGTLISEKGFACWVTEKSQGMDLNGDGDTDDHVLHVRPFEVGGEVTNVGLAGMSAGPTGVSGRWFAFGVEESSQSNDINGDGDLEDFLLHVYDFETGATTALFPAAAPRSFPARTGLVSGKWLAFGLGEDVAESDLNGDGDTSDFVLHLRDLETGETTNLGLAGYVAAHSENWTALEVQEQSEGRDLNNDGDTEDGVLHVRDLATGETTNLGLALGIGPSALLSGSWLAARVHELEQEIDLNGDGETDDGVLHVVDLDSLSGLPLFLRADCRADGRIRALEEAIFFLNYRYRGGPPTMMTI